VEGSGHDTVAGRRDLDEVPSGNLDCWHLVWRQSDKVCELSGVSLQSAKTNCMTHQTPDDRCMTDVEQVIPHTFQLEDTWLKPYYSQSAKSMTS
jgi:hypothetical protein